VGSNPTTRTNIIISRTFRVFGFDNIFSLLGELYG